MCQAGSQVCKFHNVRNTRVYRDGCADNAEKYCFRACTVGDCVLNDKLHQVKQYKSSRELTIRECSRI